MGNRKEIKRNLARVIITSSLRGLAAVARLAGIKSNNTTRKYGKSIRKMVTGSRVDWQTSVKEGKPNFSLAMRNEHNIRKFNLWMNFIDLKRYGHEVNNFFNIKHYIHLQLNFKSYLFNSLFSISHNYNV